MTTMLVIPFGTVDSLYYFIPRDREYKRQYASQAVWFLGLSGIFILMAVSVFGNRLFSLSSLSYLLELYMPMTFYIVLMTISLPMENLLFINGNPRGSSVVTVASELLKSICIITATVLTRSLKVMMYALVFFASIRLMTFFFIMFQSKLFVLPSKRIDLKKFGEHFRYSFSFGMSVAVATIRRFMHQYFVSFMFTIKDFAIYAVGSFQIPILLLTYKTVSNVLLTKISEYQRENRLDKLLEVWNNGVRKLAIIYFPVTAFFIIASREFILAFFTNQYVDSIPIFLITLFQIPFNSFPNHSILKAYAQNQFLFKLNVVFLLITAAFLYMFVSLFGIIGAALASVLSLALVNMLEILRIKKVTGVHLSKVIPWRVLTKVVVICVLCSLITLSLINFVPTQSSLYIFIVKFIIFSAIYVLVSYYANLLLTSEKKYIKELIQKYAPVVFKIRS
jgi:O-antigen/teichoic acid export membrane protein